MTTQELVNRVITRTDMRGRCWVWRGKTVTGGYGRIIGRPVHRLVYEWTFGPIGEGLVIMHACDTPSCVNPAHLSAGTQADNLADMRAKGRQRSVVGPVLRDQCSMGHALDAATRFIDSRGGRRCRTCSRERQRAYNIARRASK